MDVRSSAPPLYAFGSFRLDAGRMTLTYEGAQIATTPRVISTLLYLVEHSGELVSRDAMLRALWPGRIAEEANLSQAISSVRKALASQGDGTEWVLTVPGQGYRFTGDVVRESAVAQTSDRRTPLDFQVTPAVSKQALVIPRRWPAVRLAVLVAALGLCAALVGGWVWLRRVPVPAAGHHVLVLAALKNDTGEPAFDHVIPRVLQVDLSQSPVLDVAGDAKIGETLGLMKRPRDTVLTESVAREVCARNDGGALVTPTVDKLGQRYLLTLDAQDCVSGRPLYAEKRDVSDREGIAGALDGLSNHLRRRLGETQASIVSYDVPLAAARTSSFDALHAYSEGVWLAGQGKVVDAIPLYRQAVALDPGFAQAYLGLAEAYLGARQYLEDTQAMSQAYALRSGVSTREQLFITYRYNYVVTKDVVAALQSLRALADIYPRDAEIWTHLSYLQNDLGQYDDAIASGRRALGLDPHGPAPYVVLMRALIRGGHPEHVEAIGQSAIKAGVADGRVREMLDLNRSQIGDDAGALSLYRSSIGTPYEHDVLLQYLSLTWGQGRGRYTQALIARADELGRGEGLRMDWPIVAACYADIGMDSAARQLLDALSPDLRTDKYFLTAAQVGDPAKVRANLARALVQWPHDTLLHEEYAPEAQATLAMRAGDPAAAVRVMDAAGPIRFRNLDAPYVRAEALLQAKDAAGAAKAFREILAHTGWSNWAHYPLSYLGLARALHLSGQLDESRREYLAFFAAWKQADPDLPAVVQAKAEYAALTRH